MLGDRAHDCVRRAEFSQWAQNLSELSEQRVQAERMQGEARGRAEGLVQGKTEGLAEGEARGEVKGRALGEASALLMVLRSRGIEVSAELEQRISSCSDPALLAAWLQGGSKLPSSQTCRWQAVRTISPRSCWVGSAGVRCDWSLMTRSQSGLQRRASLMQRRPCLPSCSHASELPTQ